MNRRVPRGHLGIKIESTAAVTRRKTPRCCDSKVRSRRPHHFAFEFENLLMELYRDHDLRRYT
jgi:hypothetical protein